MSSKTMAKRAAAGTLALAVCLTGGAALASSAQAATGFKFDTRVAGEDRFGTAVEASKMAFPNAGDAKAVVIVQDEATVDGLSASYVAGINDAPILYVKKDSVPSDTAAEIKRLGVTKLFIVGGTSVVSRTVEASFSGMTVVRYFGADRYGTAAKVAEAGSTKPGKVFIASGTAPADALAVGPIAFKQHYPILLTESMNVPTATSDELTALGVSNRIAVGGNVVISPTTYDDLKATSRLSGADRQGTAIEVAKYAIASEGFSSADLALVGNQDRNTADALVASPLAGQGKGVPLLFSRGATLGDTTTAYISGNAAKLTGKGYVFGGIVAVPTTVSTEATVAASGAATSNQSYTVTGEDTVVNSTTGSRTYTVSGLTAGVPIDIALVTAASVNGSTFPTLDSTNRTAALSTSSTSTIDQINGVAVTAPAATLPFTPSGTSITFRVKAAGGEVVVPVVFSNADGDDAIAVNLSGAAKEAVGVGGQVTFQTAPASAPTEAVAATAHASTDAVTEVWGTTGFSDGVATGQFMLKDSDTYKLNGAVITKAQFVSILSPGDTVANIANYVADGSAANTYNITADVVATSASAIAPSATPSTVTPGKVKVTYDTGSESTLGSTVYKLQRRQVSAANTPVAGSAGLYATIDTRKVTAYGIQTYTDTVPSGSYEYRVVAVSPSFSGTADLESSADNVAGVLATVSTNAVLAPPALQRVYLTSNATSINNLNKGDVFKVVLSQPVNDPATGARLTVGGQTITYRSAAGSAIDGSATFSVNASAETVDGVSQAAGHVLTVTMLADPGATVSFSTATVSGASGIGNSAGIATGWGGANNLLTRDVVS